MKLSSEFKIGMAFIAALALLIVGFNFLKGVDIFSPTDHYYAYYPDAKGLVVSNNVMVRGYKVGQVRKVTYDLSKENAFRVEIAISADVQLPKGTKMVLADDGLLGGKIIDLVLPEQYNTNFVAENSELPGETAIGLQELVGGMVPMVESVITQLDSTIEAINDIVRSEEMNNMLASLDETTANLKYSTKKLNSMLDNEVPSLLNNVNTVAADLKVVSGNLKETDFAGTIAKVDATIADIDQFIDDLNSPQGTVGALVKDRSLYNNLDSTVNSANALIIDLKANPKRYVHFSLFGGKDKKEKTKK